MQKILLSTNLLVHYDPTKEIIVHTDASPIGVACLLNHKFVNSDRSTVERPVLFASCSLTQTQQRYAQIDREALAIIFAVTKLRKFLWGRAFTLLTDNQPMGLSRALVPTFPARSWLTEIHGGLWRISEFSAVMELKMYQYLFGPH